MRPVQEDIGFFTSAIAEWHGIFKRPARALILGVTPEIYSLPWPQGSTIQAIDRTREMIEHVWPGPPHNVTCADWLEMPFLPSSMDVVFCDGGLHLLSYPDAQNKIANKLADLIAPGGYCIFRLFVPPPQRESPESVMAALHMGMVPDTNCLKLRLGMALQDNPHEGVRLGSVWERLFADGVSCEALAEKLGWDVGQLSAIHAYRDSMARYYFVTREQACVSFCKSTNDAFALQKVLEPTYPMGSQCPTAIFRRNLLRTNPLASPPALARR